MNPAIVRLLCGEIEGPIVIGHLRSGVASGRGASSNDVWLSVDTLRKQRLHHPELSLEFYESLRWFLKNGHIVDDVVARCFHVIGGLEADGGGHRFKATLKIVRSNARVMLLSIYKIRDRDYRRILRKTQK